MSLKGIKAAQGSAFSQVIATFHDTASNPIGSYSATVNWGDGTGGAGAIATDPAGGYDVVAGHTYSQAGNFFVTVTVQNTDGRNNSGTATGVEARVTGQIHYRVTIDTSSLAGQTGYLGLQFNPATSTTQSAAAAIDNVTITGGSVQPSVNLDGGAQARWARASRWRTAVYSIGFVSASPSGPASALI